MTNTELVDLVAARPTSSAALRSRNASARSVDAGDKVFVTGFGRFNPTSRTASQHDSGSHQVRRSTSLLINKGGAAYQATRLESSGIEDRHGGEQAVGEDS